MGAGGGRKIFWRKKIRTRFSNKNIAKLTNEVKQLPEPHRHTDVSRYVILDQVAKPTYRSRSATLTLHSSKVRQLPGVLIGRAKVFVILVIHWLSLACGFLRML